MVYRLLVLESVRAYVWPPVAQLKRVAFIGNSLPRRCGIASFTTDLHEAVLASRSGAEACIVAMNDDGCTYDYTSDVKFQISESAIEDYLLAADFLNTQHYDIACLQHEFGIFGGDAGSHILTLLSRLTMPVVTTLHTVLAKPTPAQYEVLRRVTELSSVVIVIQDRGHCAWHPRFSVRRAKPGEGKARLRRKVRHSDLWAAFPEQGHRSDD
jgi:hypothetical protein